MKVLGIETSCDETSAAVVEDGRRILSNIVASQVEVHARYGGIVPEVASRQHLLSAVPVLSQAMASASVGWQDLSGVAVTRGPGLAGSLIVGVNLAKGVAFARGLPLIGVNHLEGHIYAAWLLEKGEEREVPQFPLLCLVVSGAHSDLVLMRGHGQYVRLGRTLDDAAGEAFDKVARVLHLGYPGGPVIQRKAQGAMATFPLPRAWLRGTANFSFSGLKTAVLRLVEELDVFSHERSEEEKEALVAQVAASFQEAVVDVLAAKTVAAAQQRQVQQIVLAGGVAANALLRQTLVERSPVPVITPRPILCTDNAAMIAAAGYYRLAAGERSGWDMDVYPGLKLGVGG